MSLFTSPLAVVQIFEFAGAILSILGAELMSRQTRYAHWGWAFWLLATITFAMFSLMAGHYFMLATQLWFVKTNIQGIRTYLMPTLASKQMREGTAAM